MPKTFNIITLGCKVNQFESAHISQVLADAGWRSVARGQMADITVVNTCIVTQSAAHQSRQAVRKAIRENPGGRVAAIGCYGQVFPKELLDIEGLDMVVGNSEKGGAADLILRNDPTQPRVDRTESFGREPLFDIMPIRGFPGRARAFVKIQDGCESFCSYCIVPYARGPYRSLPAREVLSMLEALAGSGYREAVLTGIHLGMYGVDLPGNSGLVSLLQKIGRSGFPMRIRLSSLEPSEIGNDLIRMAAEETWLCPHFHIPLQSGNDRVLKKMNRTYGGHEFARLVERIHDKISQAAIGADVMCGFPGESEDEHRDSVSLIEGLPV